MKKFLILLIEVLFTITAAFAAMSQGAFKQILRTGTPEEVQNAITGGVDMDITQALCYASRYSKTHGVVNVLVKNGADIKTNQCYSLGLARKTHPLTISSYTTNPVTAEDLIKLGAPLDDFWFLYAYKMDMARAFIDNVPSYRVESYLDFARSEMNDPTELSYRREGYKQIASYIQSLTLGLPQYVGKKKVDLVMEFGQPDQKMEVEDGLEVWTYYKHTGDLHYNGSIQGSSTYWGLGVSTSNATVASGYTASNSEKMTFVFQNGVITKATKNFDRQLH